MAIGLMTALAARGAEPEYAWPESSPAQLKEDIFGVRFRQVRENLASCYENGIGTPVNYALAAKIYWQAYTRGFVKGRDKVRRLMAFIKEP